MKPESRIEGLQIGADDYVAKPFEPRELLLRIGNILKRTAPPPVETLEQVAFGPYVYRLDRGELRQGDEVIHLTDREREMLRILAVAPAKPFRAARLPATAPSTNARSTCRSTGCGARSSAIPPIRCSCRRCAASAIAWWHRRKSRHEAHAPDFT